VTTHVHVDRLDLVFISGVSRRVMLEDPVRGEFAWKH